jgi:uncharacterized membrane protein YqjE
VAVKEEKVDLWEKVLESNPEIWLQEQSKANSSVRLNKLLITGCYLILIILFAVTSIYLIIFDPTNVHAAMMINITFFVIGSGVENIRSKFLD